MVSGISYNCKCLHSTILRLVEVSILNINSTIVGTYIAVFIFSILASPNLGIVGGKYT